MRAVYRAVGLTTVCWGVWAAGTRLSDLQACPHLCMHANDDDANDVDDVDVGDDAEDVDGDDEYGDDGIAATS